MFFFFVFLELGDKIAWSQHGYHKKFASFWEFTDNVDHIDESLVSPDEFIEKYEKPYIPVVIRGTQRDWKAQHKWTIEVGRNLVLITTRCDYLSTGFFFPETR